MPRTKISKNAKRNREVANQGVLEARLRETDNTAEQFLCDSKLKMKMQIQQVEDEINMLKIRLPAQMLNMKISDLMNMNIKSFEEFRQHAENSAKGANAALNATNETIKSLKKKSKDDEGYLTEDSGHSTRSRNSRNTRPLGPLLSAKAKSRNRRSRSACNFISENTNQAIHASRSKYKTPLLGRVKACSADRTNTVTPKVTPNTPLSMLRYPKLGELVISCNGSPVVAQSAPDITPNVNIPIQNGVISLLPTRIETLDPDILTKIDTNTLTQIKQLQTNLNIIMNYAKNNI